MKYQGAVLALAIWSVAGFATAATENSISLDRVVGECTPGTIVPGEVTFELRATVSDLTYNIVGLAAGFQISSPDGATWGIPEGDTVDGFGKHFSDLGGVPMIMYYSADGSGADSVGFLGFSFPPPAIDGWPSRYDQVSFFITIHVDRSLTDISSP